MRRKPFSKIERANNRNEKLKDHFKGSGLYRFKNRNANSTLHLEKPANDGRTIIPANGVWEGDSFFLKLVPREALVISCLTIPPVEQTPSKTEESVETPKNLVENVEIDKKTTNETVNKKKSNKVKEKKMNKLLLDQPDVVTTKGTVEHVVADEQTKKLNEIEELEEETEGSNKLISEDPMAGITIL